MIELNNLSKEYNAGTDSSIKAVDKISVTFEEGKWYTIIGPNASGKSTLLKLLAGSVLPTSGTVTCQGQDISNLLQYQRAHIFQFIEQNTEENLVPSMTIEENMLLVIANKSFPSLKQSSDKDRKNQIIESLSYFQMGLENKLKTQVRFLSVGQKQAVVLAKAILSDAKVLLLDEFVAAIDPKTVPVMLKIVQDMVTQKGLTVLMVTHDLDQIVGYEANIIFMNEGRILANLQQQVMTKDKLLSLYTESIKTGILL
jgi:putative ABC transport system ATP-binding protein